MRIYPPALSAGEWLPSLKAKQLQRIAFLTGTLSSGTKPVLIDRLGKSLKRSELKDCSQNGDRDGYKARDQPKGTMSILSIDMGIRNLAYAHLLVPPSPSREGRLSDNNPEHGSSSLHAVPTLNAWNRLAISSFPCQQNSGSELDSPAPISVLSPTRQGNPSTVGSKSKSKSKASSKSSRSKGGRKAEEEEREEKKNKRIDVAPELSIKESFAPDLYAAHAYTLITSLLSAYNPTHILIERQRFRSGGGSAVQEWTIRVGVFEGMLYAVLHTLQQQLKTGKGPDIVVQGIDPQRVARFWVEKGEYHRHRDTPSATTTTKQERTEIRVHEAPVKNKRVTSKEGKKAKIDLVGRWVSGCRDDVSSSSSSSGMTNDDDDSYDGHDYAELKLGENGQTNEMVDAYIRKWKGGRKKAAGEDRGIDIGKLDDLADCLLQGVTWLKWQKMRANISRNGFSAIPDMSTKD